MNAATLALFGSVLSLAALPLGAVVSVQAFRAARRSGDQTTRYLAAGLALVLVVSPLVGVAEEIAHDALVARSLVAGLSLIVLERGIRFLGVCLLVYALYAKRRL